MGERKIQLDGEREKQYKKEGGEKNEEKEGEKKNKKGNIGKERDRER